MHAIHKAEVEGMLDTEYNEAEVKELFKEEGRAEGLAQGMAQGADERRRLEEKIKELEAKLATMV